MKYSDACWGCQGVGVDSLREGEGRPWTEWRVKYSGRVWWGLSKVSGWILKREWVETLDRVEVEGG